MYRKEFKSSEVKPGMEAEADGDQLSIYIQSSRQDHIETRCLKRKKKKAAVKRVMKGG